MTPEQLEEIEGIDADVVEQIQLAVNGYYGQFEAAVETPSRVEPEASSEESATVQQDSSAAPAADDQAVAENESVTIVNTERPETN
jgi:hypothetical protein